MSEILADLYIAEAVVDNNHRDFNNDSTRQLLKQSILARYGYTLKDLDTSFMWYGANLTAYNDVNDRTIEVLEKKIAEVGAAKNAVTQTYAGDSVMMWSGTNFLIVKPTSPSRFLTFRYDGDDEWKPGDIFTLRAKFVNSSGTYSWSLSGEYEDESFEITSNRFNGDGWQEISFISDSLKMPVNLYGNINFDVKEGTLVVDSLQLVRKPLDPTKYSQRYRQRHYDLKRKRSVVKVKDSENETIVEP